MDYCLIAYPLSSGFMQAFRERIGGEPVVSTLMELRSMGLWRLLRALRNMKAENLYLPLEDINSTALLPVMEIVAGLTSAKRIYVVRPDLSFEPVRRRQIAWRVAKLLWRSLANLWIALHAFIETGMLLRRERIAFRHSPARGVLYLKTNLWFGIKAGGSVGHIAGVVNALNRNGHPVTFVSAEPPLLVDGEVRLADVPAPKVYGLPYELNNYLFQAGFLKRARQLLAASQVQFIYQRLSVANYLGVKLSREFNVPLVVEYNGSEAWVSKNWGNGLRFHRLAVSAEMAMLKHAHLVVTISEVLRDELIAAGIAPERIVSYPNCIDKRIFDPALYDDHEIGALRAKYNIGRDATLVTFIGTFGQWHGVEVLAHAIESFAKLHEGWLRQHKVHFMLVGDGQKMAEVRKIVANAVERGYCTLTGLVPQAEAPLHLAASNILVSPHVQNSDGSRFFGSPTKLFEYMAMGKGIVASDLDQIGEVLADSLRVASLPDTSPDDRATQLAVLCRPGSVDELMRGIAYLAENSGWRDVLGRNARNEAISKYTWEQHVRAALDGLERVARL